MGVDVRQTGGDSVVSFFEDTFNRASNGDLGGNWIDTCFRRTPIVDPIDSCTFSIGAQIDVVQGLNVAVIGNNNPNTQWPGAIFAQAARRGTLNRNQFVQATFISQTGAAGNPDFGLALLVNDQVGDLYGLIVGTIGPPHNLAITRFNGTTPTAIANLGNIVVQGDVLRLEAIVTVATEVTLEAFRNGVSLGASVDNAANRIQVGYSGGFYARGFPTVGGVPSTAQWRNFSCGVL